MPYTTGSIEVNVLTCEADHLADCGFMFLWNAAYVWWSCCSPLTPVLAAAPLAELCRALGKRKLGERQRWGGWAGPGWALWAAPAVGLWRSLFLGEWMCNHRLVSQAPLLVLMTLILKFKCEILNTNASKTCSHSSLQYLRVSLDLVINSSKLQSNQM